jgi:hypothetical protein
MYRLENFAASFERSNERCVMERTWAARTKKIRARGADFGDAA